LGGRATLITGFPGSNILSCGGDPTLKPYPCDPQEARRLIKEGGHEGYEFTVASYPWDGIPEIQNIIEILAGYWQKVGLRPKIFMTEWATFRETWRAQKVQNTISTAGEKTNPECGTLLSYIEERYASNQKRALFHVPKIDECFKKAKTTLDVAEVARNLGEIHRIAYDQHLTIPICMVDDEIASTKRVPDWNPGRRRDDRNFNDIITKR
jgi:peptide/nickel transport system substrate-binding protein